MMKRILFLAGALLVVGFNTETKAGSSKPLVESKTTKAEKKITLKPMDLEGFKVFRAKFIERSIQNRSQSDLDSKDITQERSISEVGRALPLGLETPNNFIFDVIADDTGKKIGTLWYIKHYEGKMPVVFLYDICIFDEFQNQGYGTALLKVYEAKAKEMGAHKLRLHVFAHNERARKLYTNLGFFLTGYNMAKNLSETKK